MRLSHDLENNSRLTRKRHIAAPAKPRQFKSGPRPGQLSPDLCIVFESSDRGLGAAQNNKKTKWIKSKRKQAAHENSAAAVSDTERSKSLDFSTLKRVYFCLTQLNLENRFRQNFDYWQLYLAGRQHFIILETAVGLGFLRHYGPNVLCTPPLPSIPISCSITYRPFFLCPSIHFLLTWLFI